MLKRKVIFLIGLVFFLESCAGTFEDIKRGMTGAKQKSSDEFLVEKKDPLILPPDYENLPTPDNTIEETSDVSDFEKTMTKNTSSEDNSASTNSSEMSIIEKIRSK